MLASSVSRSHQRWPGEGGGLEHLEAGRAHVVGLLAPGHVHLLVLVEVQAGEVEHRVLGPDARADLDLGDAGLLVELAAGGVVARLGAVDAAAGDLPPGRLLPIGRVGGRQQQHVAVAVEQHDTRRSAAEGVGAHER